MAARGISESELVSQFAGALYRHEGALFVGAGLSLASGLPTWTSLIRQLAGSLNLIPRATDNLPQLAQFCINGSLNNRGPFIGALRAAIASPRAKPNANHDALCLANLRTIWTTNYDTLLEEAFALSRLVVRTRDADLTADTSPFDIEILKPHGCVTRSAPEELVVTQEDYEDFTERRPAMLHRLRHDLMNKSFLFIGYGYRDPNIAAAMVEVRRLCQRDTREHFMILGRALSKRDQRVQSLWLEDLQRFGIRSLELSSHKRLPAILRRIAIASRGDGVYVTGSHLETSRTAGKIGSLLARETSAVFLDGQSEGIGRVAANAFGTECVNRRIELRDRIRYFPNPYAFNPAFANSKAHLGVLQQWRSGLMRSAKIVLVFDGGIGTKTEVALAKQLGCVIVPVPGSRRPPGKANNDSILARDLLLDREISKKLPKSYLSKAKTGVNADDVIECVKKVLS